MGLPVNGSDVPSGMNFKVLPLKQEPIWSQNGRSNGDGSQPYVGGEWVDLCVYIHQTLRVGDDRCIPVELPTMKKVNSFRAFLAGYGREYLKSYENGWSFAVRLLKPENEGDPFIVTVWKVRASVLDKARRSNKHKK